jgi:NADPH:quinone reductase-like Zn-dependent oxidoreductase
MRALRAYAKHDPSRLVYEEAPVPRPAPDDALVRVHASGVTPTELDWPSTWLRHDGSPRTPPIVPGHEVAGVVEAVGPDAAGVSDGDAVYGLIDFRRDGADAEYAAVRAADLAPKPANLTHAEVSAVPLSGLTAWQALFDHGGLGAGQRVLVHGGAGGVGSFAVQLAAARGATVIATGLPEDVERLQGLGATKVVDYREDVAEQVLADGGEVDALLDLVSFDADSFGKLAKAVRRGGKVGSTAGGATDEALEAARLTGQVIVAMPNRETLTTLLADVERGALRVDVEETLPLDAAAKALETFMTGHAKGKIVVTVED